LYVACDANFCHRFQDALPDIARRKHSRWETYRMLAGLLTIETAAQVGKRSTTNWQQCRLPLKVESISTRHKLEAAGFAITILRFYVA
jgi:hypothetical protein